jgi:hypothetical protein
VLTALPGVQLRRALMPRIAGAGLGFLGFLLSIYSKIQKIQVRHRCRHDGPGCRVNPDESGVLIFAGILL